MQKACSVFSSIVKIIFSFPCTDTRMWFHKGTGLSTKRLKKRNTHAFFVEKHREKHLLCPIERRLQNFLISIRDAKRSIILTYTYLVPLLTGTIYFLASHVKSFLHPPQITAVIRDLVLGTAGPQPEATAWILTGKINYTINARKMATS